MTEQLEKHKERIKNLEGVLNLMLSQGVIEGWYGAPARKKAEEILKEDWK